MNQMVEPKRIYSLQALILDRNPELPLDEKEFNDLKQVKSLLRTRRLRSRKTMISCLETTGSLSWKSYPRQ